MNLIEELRWRGMIQDIMPETEQYLLDNKTAGYIGFDPTSDSLHIGSLVPIFLLMHMQKAGHTPIALVGGATGMVGDPSGKSEERNLLDEATLQKNIDGVKAQLSRFLDFDSKENPAKLLNNFDWIGKMSFLEFIRDVGKHLTVNYMMAKDSVKKRIETGISFTEFSYQLVQGYDFYHLWKNEGCALQCGGSDQWGNITSGTELIRRMDGGKAYAFTCPLITKADGGKFGKTESGNVWLDAERTSPYKFYQFWINTSDEDAKRYIKIFTFRTQEEIKELETTHAEAPHTRILQNALAEDITTLVHCEEALETAKIASSILFGKTTFDALNQLKERDMLEVFDGVPTFEVSKDSLENGINIIDFLATDTQILKSKGEARRALKENSISINKQKVQEDMVITKKDILKNNYVLIQRGRRNYFLVRII
ncbi:MAG: tyrosine--tRNA ligase [Chitinophagales bacterium]